MGKLISTSNQIDDSSSFPSHASEENSEIPAKNSPYEDIESLYMNEIENESFISIENNSKDFLATNIIQTKNERNKCKNSDIYIITTEDVVFTYCLKL